MKNIKIVVLVLLILIVGAYIFFFVPQIYYSIDANGDLNFRMFGGGKMYAGKVVKGSTTEAAGQHSKYKFLARWNETSPEGNPVFYMAILKNGVVVKTITTYQ